MSEMSADSDFKEPEYNSTFQQPPDAAELTVPVECTEADSVHKALDPYQSSDSRPTAQHQCTDDLNSQG